VIPVWHVKEEADDAILCLSGDWLVRKTGMRTMADVRLAIGSASHFSRVRFDTRQLGEWDSALVAFILGLQSEATQLDHPLALDLAGLPEALRRLLALARADPAAPKADTMLAKVTFVARVGLRTLALGLAFRTAADLIGLMVLSVKPALSGRLYARAADIALLMQECGAGALGIVAVVNGLIGAILAFVGAVELRRFGAEIYVADLVGVAVVREMAAVMTAIVMAGRTGGAYAAQIATMQGNEELDALQALGVPLHQYIVFPRVAALVMMMPVLYFYGCFVGLLGGLVVSVAMLKLSPTLFLEQLRPAVAGTEFCIGLTKSVVFGAYIALAGCRIGLSAGRSASDVGHAATGAVVAGIIGIIAMDAVFAACTNALGL